ncbi:protein NYNRIN-like [Lynx canadensis]|uniref:protein NYNRIN-like n=1 Tax=Lynx canadensis TaxID=61383 RepID=UPI0011B0EEC4|nr:protein NYNRIN-like [Lynx canadensis]
MEQGKTYRTGHYLMLRSPGLLTEAASSIKDRGNNLADQTARQVAQNPIQVLPAQLPDPGPRDLPPQPEYSEDDLIWMRKLPMTQVTDGWWRDSRDRLILPDKLGHAILAKILQNAHPHATAQGHRKRGTIPEAHWEVDFTEVKPDKYGYKYLLVFVDTFSGWTEAFPTKKETAQIVAKKILEKILPRYGFPVMIGSDNGPAFVSKVSQGLASVLGAD